MIPHVVTFFLIVNCTCNFENVEIAMKFIETWWKCANDALFGEKLSSEFFKCIIVIFQLADDFTHFASQWLFVCATFLD